MPLIVLGINHISAPVEVREKLAIADHALSSALAALLALPTVIEGALLSTCNRTEAYAILSSEDSDPEDTLADFLAGLHGLRRHEFDGHLYCYREGAAASHLFSVATGIDSMILGEPDIQRQVRHAFDVAQSARSLGPLLYSLFQEALVVGKRARTETEIARGAFSVGAAAVKLVSQIFGESLQGRSILILGAGKMSEVTARHLQAAGTSAVLVANRTFERAEQLATQFGGQAYHFDSLPDLLVRADVVVCSTAAPHPILTQAMIRQAMRSRQNRPLTLIDIAVPRDVEAEVDSLSNVYLFNIDHLQKLVAGARQARTNEVVRVREMVAGSVTEYLKWRRGLEVAPLIIAVREKLESERLSALAGLRSQLPGLSEREWNRIERAMQSLIGKLAHTATQAIKAGAGEEAGTNALEAIRQAFGIPNEKQADPIPRTQALPQKASGQ